MLGRRGARRALAALCLLGAIACAKIEPPPGGPPDTKPPILVSITPESLSVNPGFDGNVNFIFSEVVSEGGSPSQGYGTGDLEKLVLLSPTNKIPVVQWHRSRITVRPREGWRPNTVYRVQLLPGISDIRNNKGVKGGLVTFTTGAPVPDYTLRGIAYDWTASQPMRGGLIEAVLEPDSLVYKGITDSSGAYAFGPLPRGTYLVYVGLDQNRNGKIDPREAYDSVRVEPDSGKVPEIFAFIHDTTPPQSHATRRPGFGHHQPHLHPEARSVRDVRLDRRAGTPAARFDTDSGPAGHDSPPSSTASPRSIGRRPTPRRRRRWIRWRERTRRRRRPIPRPEREDPTRSGGRSQTRSDTAKADTLQRCEPDTLGKFRPDSVPPGARVPGMPAAGPGAMAGQKPPVKLSRPPLSDRLIVRLGQPVLPGTEVPGGDARREEHHRRARVAQGRLRGAQASEAHARRQRARAPDAHRLGAGEG